MHSGTKRCVDHRSSLMTADTRGILGYDQRARPYGQVVDRSSQVHEHEPSSELCPDSSSPIARPQFSWTQHSGSDELCPPPPTESSSGQSSATCVPSVLPTAIPTPCHARILVWIYRDCCATSIPPHGSAAAAATTAQPAHTSHDEDRGLGRDVPGCTGHAGCQAAPRSACSFEPRLGHALERNWAAFAGRYFDVVASRTC
jgi:hypothetical protein